MRILWLSNSPLAGSGYGGQTALFAKRIRDMGHEVAIAANHGVRGKTILWEDIPVFDASNPNSTLVHLRQALGSRLGHLPVRRVDSGTGEVARREDGRVGTDRPSSSTAASPGGDDGGESAADSHVSLR